MNVEELEVVPGFEHQFLQGKVWEAATDEELREGLEKAFDYRGDVTLQLKNGTAVEGYIFDRRNGATLADSCVRLLPKNDPAKLTVAYSEIAGLAFTGRDTAAGKSWEAWLKKYWEKKQAGESNIELVPEALD
ncbi:MAG TPA: hypothetical protein VFC21_05830 [Bryobacteraceae bacterium]|nr:hypothetical protein [Bryobacteraceae bacterium]